MTWGAEALQCSIREVTFRSVVQIVAAEPGKLVSVNWLASIAAHRESQAGPEVIKGELVL